MIFFFESRLPENKPIHVSLTYVYGIGSTRALLICRKLGLSLNLKVKHLSTHQISQLVKLLESLNFILANDLKRSVLLSKQKLISIKSYRGLRRKRGFPVRGQRTHTNAQTAKKIR